MFGHDRDTKEKLLSIYIFMLVILESSLNVWGIKIIKEFFVVVVVVVVVLLVFRKFLICQLEIEE